MAKTKGKTPIPKYNPQEIEPKWQKIWEKEKIYQPDLDNAKKPFYNLMMFPYPSAEGMHVGNMYAFTGSDVYGRFKRMQGHDVFEPIGLDGFGIHSENYALKIGRHPKEQAKISEENFYRQLHMLGNSFDWSSKLETYDPQYYKWTQWILIQLFKAGLAYRKKATVNFCPQDKTVLADEQVIAGCCERCGTEVVKKELEQWFFKITDYAERLLNNIEGLDWSEKVKIAQRQWIGRSEGAQIEFKIQSRQRRDKIQVYTTRPDTLFGATFMVLAPEHPLASQISNFQFPISNRKVKEIKEYIKTAQSKTEQERIAEGKEKKGVNTGLVAINPVNNEEIPVWIADYVLMGYGTGAIMAVPAHDPRDFEFAKKYNLPIIQVIKSQKSKVKNQKLNEAYMGEGEIINSDEWNGIKVPEEIGKIIDWLEEKGIGRREVHYHLRDWLISRQRYWGPPIPMIDCPKCGWQPVPEKDLPVLLPDVKDWKPKGGGESPLASIESFVKTKCPNCGADARRETDVSDTFLDSAWYFFRYIATDLKNVPFPSKAFEKTRQAHLNNDARSGLSKKQSLPHSLSESLSKSKNLKTKNNETAFSSLSNDLPLSSKIGNLELEIGSYARMALWLPVSMYIGGAEHSVLHLLYSRFLTMFFKDLGLISFDEPYSKFRAHGLLIKEGAKMSKSRGNVVIPDEYIRKFGADTLRLYLMFLGPFTQGGDFYDTGIEGMYRFVKRIWTLFFKVKLELKSESSEEGLKMMHKTIKKVTEDIENLRYNTAIASMMEFYNFLTKQQSISKDEVRTMLLLISPFAPHISEELWSGLGFENSIHKAPWPDFKEEYLIEKISTIAVQLNGKTRDVLKVKLADINDQQKIEATAKKSQKIDKYLKNRPIQKVIYVPGKIINFVLKNGNPAAS